MSRSLWNILRVKGRDLINIVVQPIGVEQVGMSSPTPHVEFVTGRLWDSNFWAREWADLCSYHGRIHF